MTVLAQTPVTQMRSAIEEIPQAARRLTADHAAARSAAARLRALDPSVLVTVARGSSDHAALYLKYAVELTLGLPVASLGPSVASVYGRSVGGPRAAALMISQSGQSADLIAVAQALGRSGAWRLTLTNSAGSPLAQEAEATFDILAGPETAVAATKSFVSSVVAGLLVVAHWAGDDALLGALDVLPDAMAKALACDWSAAIGPVLQGGRAMVLGRGPMLAIAEETALKLIECCALPAVAYSTAEVLHGPAAVLTDGFPVLLLSAPGSVTAAGDQAALTRLAAQGARLISPVEGAEVRLPPTPEGGHPLLTPLLSILPVYALIETAARRLGLNPDRPAHLSKVTNTR